MIRVYTASKLRHAKMWKELCDKSHSFIFHARWLKHVKIGTPDGPEHAPDFWMQDQQDVKDSDALLVYAAPGDKLRGALVEVGMALAYGIPVVIIGEHEDYGTWRHHPGVFWVTDFDHAEVFLSEMPERFRNIQDVHERDMS